MVADEPSRVRATLRLPGERPRGSRASGRRSSPASATTLRLKTRKKALERLQAMDAANAELVVRAVDSAGNRRRIVRPVALSRR